MSQEDPRGLLWLFPLQTEQACPQGADMPKGLLCKLLNRGISHIGSRCDLSFGQRLGFCRPDAETGSVKYRKHDKRQQRPK